MRVVLRQPRREVEVAEPPGRVSELLKRFDVVAESVLVIRGDELLTVEDTIGPDDVIELRPVISGG
jgi:sulfur carrier protein